MTINFHWILAIVALAGILHGTWAAAPAAEPDKAGVRPERLWVYIGTYTRRASKGIYLGHLDLATGRLESVELAGEVTNPSFLAIHPSKPLLYAVGELGDFAGKTTGAVRALAIDPQ